MGFSLSSHRSGRSDIQTWEPRDKSDHNEDCPVSSLSSLLVDAHASPFDTMSRETIPRPFGIFDELQKIQHLLPADLVRVPLANITDCTARLQQIELVV